MVEDGKNYIFAWQKWVYVHLQNNAAGIQTVCDLFMPLHYGLISFHVVLLLNLSSLRRKKRENINYDFIKIFSHIMQLVHGAFIHTERMCHCAFVFDM